MQTRALKSHFSKAFKATTGVPPGEAGTRSTVNTAALGTLLGAGAGAAIGAAAGDVGLGAAIGAGSGLLFGTAGGAEAGDQVQ